MLRLASKRDTRGHMTRFYSATDAGLIFGPASIPNLYAHFAPGGAGTTWVDSQGGAGTGTLQNGAAWSGGAVNFDGSNDCVDGFATTIAPVGARTLCIWAKSTDATFARRGLMGTRGASGAASTSGFVMGYYDSGAFQYFTTTFGTWRPTLTMPAVNTRNFWALTHSGANVILYLNGVQVASTSGFTAGETASGYTGLIGGEQVGSGTENWQGTIDRVLTYSRVLTAAEILALAQNLS